jgi:hypothetical protein
MALGVHIMTNTALTRCNLRHRRRPAVRRRLAEEIGVYARIWPAIWVRNKEKI